MTRPRSNALSGTSDPRWVAPMELNLRAELEKPFEMAPTLREFLQKVYDDDKIMSGSAVTGPGKNLADEIYDLYSGTGVGAAGVTNFQQNKAFILDLWKEVERHPRLSKAKLQYTRATLADLAAHLKAGKKAAKRFFNDFIYFTVVGGGAKVRVYANVKPSYAVALVKLIRDHMAGTPQHGVQSFKVVGPGAMAGRADTVVVYLASKPAADALASELAKRKTWFHPQVPAMTSQVAPGVGVATGAEPVPQATGLGEKPKGYPESAQSFGTIRSELIAAAVLNYDENKHVFGEGADVFAKFVATAFRGYGLDPAKPGD